MLNEVLSQKLISIRDTRNLTQEQAAEMCNLSTRYWGKMERCEVNVSLKTLDKIARGLCVSASELLDETAQKYVEDFNELYEPMEV